MTEEQYYRIARACDSLLRHPDATLEWVAIPWLHLLNEHPVYLSKYAGLDGALTAQGWFTGARCVVGRAVSRGYTSAYRAAGLVKNLSRAVRESTEQKKKFNETGNTSGAGSGIRTADVVIVSHLVNVDHLDQADDFYFGSLQRLLADRGVTSHLLLRNQTHRRTSELVEQARRDGPCARDILSDVATVREELSFLKRCVITRRQLHQVALGASSSLGQQVARRAGDTAVSGEVLANLRLYSQIKEICRRLRPSIVIALYEGHAWERCVFHAARTAGDPILCVGYQHTILRAHSHAVKRSLGHGSLYDPDVILTLGEVTRNILEASEDLRNVRIVTFGTHRREEGHAPRRKPNRTPVFLVLPEGIESECIYLFRYALECARCLPHARFILRTHPVLPFEKLGSKLKEFQSVPGNIEISRGTPIEEDFERAGYMLYRGSSTAIYGILAGLKPFYVVRPDEMSIDPLGGLAHWREHVVSVDDLMERFAADQEADGEQGVQDWRKACDFCNKYTQPITPAGIDTLVALPKASPPAMMRG